MANLQTALILGGAGGLVGVARRLHRITLGDRPFVVLGLPGSQGRDAPQPVEPAGVLMYPEGMHRRVVLVALSLSVSSACSFIQNRPSQPTACQTRWPALDALGAAAWGVGAIAVSGLPVDVNCASDDSGCFTNQDDKTAAVAMFGLLAATQVASALYGLHRTSKCGDGGFTPPMETQGDEDDLPGSCKAAIISAGLDGFQGRPTSDVTIDWKRRCQQDQALAEANRQYASEMTRLERLQAELELERARAARKAERARSEAEMSRARATTGATDEHSSAASGKLLVFGGRDHKQFLGCICSEFDTDSIFNRYGTFGSSYFSDSIWNKYGDYGSRYSDTSACNSYASHPPVVVTEAGTFVGYLTLDRYKTNAITDPDVFAWLEKKVCEQ